MNVALQNGRAWLLAALVWAPACVSPRTEVLVEVTSDLADGALQSVVVTVRSDGPAGEVRGRRVVAVGSSSERARWPVTFGVVPVEGDARRVVWVEVHGCRDAIGCVYDATGTPAEVTQRAIVGFVEGATVRLALPLTRRCQRVVCADVEACRPDDGRCVSARVDAMVLPRAAAPGRAPGGETG